MYTDGSKSDTGVGYAFVRDPAPRNFGLPAEATVFSAELVSIKKALSFIEVSDDGSYVFFLLIHSVEFWLCVILTRSIRFYKVFYSFSPAFIQRERP